MLWDTVCRAVCEFIIDRLPMSIIEPILAILASTLLRPFGATSSLAHLRATQPYGLRFLANEISSIFWSRCRHLALASIIFLAAQSVFDVVHRSVENFQS